MFLWSPLWTVKHFGAPKYFMALYFNLPPYHNCWQVPYWKGLGKPIVLFFEEKWILDKMFIKCSLLQKKKGCHEKRGKQNLIRDRIIKMSVKSLFRNASSKLKVLHTAETGSYYSQLLFSILCFEGSKKIARWA